MQNFKNSVGFITGGASGIGLGMARALGRRGMTVILADIEEDSLDTAAATLSDEGINVETEALDVADTEQYRSVAKRILARHTTIHFLFNNAGVAGPSPVGASRMADWRWVMDVNLMGVVHGVELFLPAMRDSGEPAYIINTASMAGHLATAGLASYCASKFAVVGYTEVLKAELGKSNIDVSVLCPAWVKTRIAESIRNHPDAEVAAQEHDVAARIGKTIEDEGISVEALTDRILRGMAAKTFYLFSHPEFWEHMQARMKRLQDDYAEVL